MLSSDVEKQISVFLFPLAGVVFFPQTLKPLNVFEPRHVRMIEDAVAAGIQVALAFAEPIRGMRGAGGAWAHVRRVAGVGELKILERREDGSVLVLLVGKGKAHLEQVSGTSGSYLIAEASLIRERNSLAKENIFLLNRMMKEFAKWLDVNVEERDQREAFLDRLQSAAEKVNYMCALLVPEAEEQQRLLEYDDVNERLKELSLLVEDGKAGL